MNKIDFINKIVFGYIQKDLENIKSKIPPVRGEVGNANFPIALCVLAYMEYLGGFLLGRSLGFKRNIEEYMNRCFNFSPEYNSVILRDLFRNGLAHEYFARGGISRDGIRPPMNRNYEGKAILDAQTLLDDFLNSLNAFKDELNEESFQRRKKGAENAIKKWETIHKNEVLNLPFIGNFPTHTRTSGASIYPGNIKESTTTTLPYDPNEK